jgi:hypothetical protein
MATADAGKEIVRLPMSDFGPLKRNPALVSSSERATRMVPASRSTSPDDPRRHRA